LKIISLKLRGAKGIYKGMGLDEIEIDFTTFGPGLIAFIGANGSGKTTILENLHPYRTLVSRKGKLQDHFFLKDSYRELVFEYKEKVYKSLMLIDASTEKMEGYLFENGEQITNGTVKVYDEKINEIFGQPELFFSSMFSGQMSAGFAKMKGSERRDLIYQFLDLKKYEVWEKRAAELKKELGNRKLAVVAEINLLESQIAGINVTDNDVTEKRIKSVSCETKIKELEAGLKTGNKALAEQQALIDKLGQKKQEQAEITAKIADLTKTTDELQKAHSEALKKAETDHTTELSVFQLSNKYIDMQLEDEKRHKDTINKITVEYEGLEKKLGTEKKELDEVVKAELSSKAALERAEKIVGNKDLINNTVSEIEALETGIAGLIVEEKDKLAEINALQKDVDKFMAEYNEYEKNLEKDKNAFSAANIDLKSLNKNKSEQKTAHEKELARLDENIKNISSVPCGELQEETRRQCPFLQTAYSSADVKETAIKQYEERLAGLDAEIEKVETYIKINKSVLEQREAWLKDNKTCGAKKQIDVKSATINIIREDVKTKTVELNKIVVKDGKRTDWKALQKELEKAETEIVSLKETLESLGKNEEKLVNSIKEMQVKRVSLNEEIKKNEQDIVIQRDKYSKLMSEEKAQLIVKYNDKVNNLTENFRIQKEQLDKQITEAKGQYNPEIDAEIEEATRTLKDLETELQKVEQLIQSKRVEADSLKAELVEMTNNLAAKMRSKDQIASKEAELKFLDRGIEEYQWLQTAWGPKGIPVLKMENMIIELTKIVNGFLNKYESKFRIAFVTTKNAKSSDNVIETFDIVVLDDEGAGDIENKSGGEKVIIETAIQLGLSNIILMQGKDIKTVFMDEKDGPLDNDNAMAFLGMVKQAYEDSGIYQLFLISQRTELKESISQQISLMRGEGVTLIT
jgi:exonuclease SbcC